MSGHSEHGGGSVFGVEELAEASTPVWQFLGFLILLIPLLTLTQAQESAAHHH